MGHHCRDKYSWSAVGFYVFGEGSSCTSHYILGWNQHFLPNLSKITQGFCGWGSRHNETAYNEPYL